jgi:hypothetical protein
MKLIPIALATISAPYSTSCSACSYDPTPISGDFDNATFDVDITVEGEGVTTGWHMTRMYMPSTTSRFFIIYLQRDDCPDGMDWSNSQLFMHIQHYNQDEDPVLTELIYCSSDACLTREACDECDRVAVDSRVTGRISSDINRERIRIPIENLVIEIDEAWPESCDMEITSITMDGVVHVPAE